MAFPNVMFMQGVWILEERVVTGDGEIEDSIL